MKEDPDDSVPPANRDQKDLGKSFVRSVVWTGVAKSVSQLLGWISTFVIARLLTPEDYGLFGMASVFLGLVTLVSESGIGITIVTLRSLDSEQVAQFHTLAVLLGFAGFLVCAAFAVPLGWFFHSPELPVILLVLGTSFPLSGLRVVPGALLQQDLRFKLLGMLEAVNVIILSVSMVLLAMAGFRYWTLVLGSILSTTVTSVLTVWYRPQRFRLPRWTSLRAALHFTKYQLGGNLLWYAYSNSDAAIAGRLLGKTNLGVYSLALSIARSMPEKILAMITRVTPAYFSILQDNPATLKRYLLRLTEILSIITFPMLFGLAVVADEFVALVLGAQWLGVVEPLRLLVIYAAMTSTSPLVSRVLTVRGQNQFLFRVAVVLVIVMPISFIIGSAWGPTGIAAAGVIVYPLTRIPVFRCLAKNIDVSRKEYFSAFWPAISASAAMVLAVILLKALIAPDMQLVVRLLLEVLCGAAVYVGVVLAFHRHRIQILLQFRNAWT